MSEISNLIATTKRLLKGQGLTYRDVAKSLKLSEPSVKRMFASRRLTVDRLAQVGALLGFSLAELAQEAASDKHRIATLSTEQETLLVSDMKLLLITVCALNHWTVTDITTAYQLTEAECVQRLLQLDRMQLVELLPGNRIRLRVARDFDWLPDGPIRQFFRAEGQEDFLSGSFSQPGESATFIHGMFTDAAFSQFQTELQKLRMKFSELHEESASAPLKQRYGASLLLALRRSWVPPAFAAMRRSV